MHCMPKDIKTTNMVEEITKKLTYVDNRKYSEINLLNFYKLTSYFTIKTFVV